MKQHDQSICLPKSACIRFQQRSGGTKARGEAFYNVTFERSYKDDEGKWKSSANFSDNHLLLLAKVADRAHSEIYKLRASDRQAQQLDE